MNFETAIQNRHSVRSYLDKPIEGAVLEHLQDVIKQCNQESGLACVLSLNDPSAFDSRLAHYGKFSGVSNHIALIGKPSEHLDEMCGYYGEHIVLEAQDMGLNTCWVALTFNKKAAACAPSGMKRTCVLAIGYGANQGIAHKSKSFESLIKLPEGMDSASIPSWFEKGVKAAQLAPTAMNQQKFVFNLSKHPSREGRYCVSAKAGIGFYTKIDLGIAQYHFEVAANSLSDEWEWA